MYGTVKIWKDGKGFGFMFATTARATYFFTPATFPTASNGYRQGKRYLSTSLSAKPTDGGRSKIELL
jgi:hypothetical protein